jgi:hypothetical protein
MTWDKILARLEEERQLVEANLEAEFGTPNCTCSCELTPDRRGAANDQRNALQGGVAAIQQPDERYIGSAFVAA